mmetsp:Transcript_14723/g.16291  ORF Transcript_14723/g.16291 Transcript_14723/m.16291 type:complete len:109 (+) Transcript_14723:92-418(+)
MAFQNKSRSASSTVRQKRRSLIAEVSVGWVLPKQPIKPTKPNPNNSTLPAKKGRSRRRKKTDPTKRLVESMEKSVHAQVTLRKNVDRILDRHSHELDAPILTMKKVPR